MSVNESSRAILPIPARPHSGLTTYDAKDPDTSFPPIEPIRPPAGAPNILLILIDDAGFGSNSAFGGAPRTPTFERLAEDGLKYTRFHTTSLCSPTRAALLSGRNHHTVGMGGVTEIATSAPGYSSVRPNTCAPLAETLKLNGYSTAQFGKCHEVPVWQSSPMGPFDAWPSVGGGFEHFYGFIGGETNQYAPALYDGTTPVEPDRTPEEGYHLTEDLADQRDRLDPASRSRSCRTSRSSSTSRRAPRMRRTTWRRSGPRRTRASSTQGWDKLREETFARQKALGVIPPDAELTARPADIPAWDDMPEELKPVLARQMEVYAGFMEHTDFHVGRLIDAVEDLGILDDTLVILITGDNGASAEGTVHGMLQRAAHAATASAALETVDFMACHIDEFGTPEAYNHYAVGWAHAMDTPYQWTKQVASHWGGTRNGTIVHWPNGHQGQGRGPHQFRHVIDVAPTVLEAAGLPAPTFVNGIAAGALEGASMALRASTTPTAAERHETQYFEMFCNRGIYHKGWTAVTRHSTPWVIGAAAGLRRRRVGALRTRRLDAGARPREASIRSELARAAAPVPDRGGEVQRPAARRPAGRALQPGAWPDGHS